MYPSMGSAAASLEIADMYWLLSHGEHNGKARIADEFIRFGLAGAVLGELTILGFLVITEEHYVNRAYRYEGQDGVHHWVDSEVGRVLQPVKVLNWVQHLATRVEGEVVTRLQNGQHVEDRAGILGKRTVPTPSMLPATLRVRLLRHVDEADPTTRLPQEWEARSAAYRLTTLAALAAATELDEVVAKDAGRGAIRGQIISLARNTLPPPLLTVANAVRAAATQATLSIRR